MCNGPTLDKSRRLRIQPASVNHIIIKNIIVVKKFCKNVSKHFPPVLCTVAVIVIYKYALHTHSIPVAAAETTNPFIIM